MKSKNIKLLWQFSKPVYRKRRLGCVFYSASKTRKTLLNCIFVLFVLCVFLLLNVVDKETVLLSSVPSLALLVRPFTSTWLYFSVDFPHTQRLFYGIHVTIIIWYLENSTVQLFLCRTFRDASNDFYWLVKVIQCLCTWQMCLLS